MIISMQFVFKKLVSLKTRYSYHIIESRISWDSKIKINNFNDVISEIIFWRDNIDRINRRNIARISKEADFEVHSDASDNALGVVVNNGLTCHRNFNG